MVKQKMASYIGARFTDAEIDRIDNYIETKVVSQSDLVREAVREFLDNHPLDEESQDGTEPSDN